MSNRHHNDEAARDASRRQPVEDGGSQQGTPMVPVSARTLRRLKRVQQIAKEIASLEKERSQVSLRIMTDQRRYERSLEDPPVRPLTEQQQEELHLSIKASRQRLEAVEGQLSESTKSLNFDNRMIVKDLMGMVQNELPVEAQNDAKVPTQMTTSKPENGANKRTKVVSTREADNFGSERSRSSNPYHERPPSPGYSYAPPLDLGVASWGTPAPDNEVTASEHVERMEQWSQKQLDYFRGNPPVELDFDDEPRVPPEVLEANSPIFEKDQRLWQQDEAIGELPLVNMDIAMFDAEYLKVDCNKRQRIDEWDVRRQKAWEQTLEEERLAKPLKRSDDAQKATGGASKKSRQGHKKASKQSRKLNAIENQSAESQTESQKLEEPKILNIVEVGQTYQEWHSRQIVDHYRREEDDADDIKSLDRSIEDDFGEVHWTLPRRCGNGFRRYKIARPPKSKVAIPRTIVQEPPLRRPEPRRPLTRAEYARAGETLLPGEA